MTGRYRQMLVSEEAHAQIGAAKSLMEGITGRRLSSKDIIGEFIGRRVRFMRLDRDVRAYINSFVSEMALDRRVLGLLLFGSVARGTSTKQSDIDVLVVASDTSMKVFDSVNAAVKRVEAYRVPLKERGASMRIRPMILKVGELQRFKPIYVEFLEDGMVLFERDETMSEFLNDIRKSVDYEKRIVNNAVVITWSMRR